MSRNEMIDALMPATTHAETPSRARRRLWKLTTAALRREMLMHGLIEYDDPLEADADLEDAADAFSARLLLGTPALPAFLD
ncbi:MAG: hypothetical protein IT531_09930 [Burkholderiales bacterium]|nr:hypothetical protein [Burkholderiales bacterium]